MIKNERGYTLILVLIIISATIILATALAAAAISTSKQFNKTDNLNKATDLAEMGITYYQNTAINLINTAQNNVTSATNFCTEYTRLLTSNAGEITVDGKNKFEVTLIPSTSTNFNKTTACSANLDSIKVVFASTGITNTNDQVKIEGTFYISKKSRVGEVAPNKSDYVPEDRATDRSANAKIYYEDFSFKQGNDSKVLSYSAWFKQIDLKGSNSLTIKNNAIFENSSQNGQTNITVEGDAIFYRTTPNKLVGGASICVKGNIYTVDSSDKLVLFTDFDTNYRRSCPSSYLTTWGFDTVKGMSVNYNSK